MIYKELFSPFNSNYQKLVSERVRDTISPPWFCFFDSLTPLSFRYQWRHFRWINNSKRRRVHIRSEAQLTLAYSREHTPKRCFNKNMAQYSAQPCTRITHVSWSPLSCPCLFPQMEHTGPLHFHYHDIYTSEVTTHVVYSTSERACPVFREAITQVQLASYEQSCLFFAVTTDNMLSEDKTIFLPKQQGFFEKRIFFVDGNLHVIWNEKGRRKKH